MISRRPSQANFDDATQPVHASDDTDISVPRDVRILDFKDRTSHVAVAHGPLDPTRVWLFLENLEASVQLSLEEGSARRLWEGLGGVLSRFAEVRSTMPDARRTESPKRRG